MSRTPRAVQTPGDPVPATEPASVPHPADVPPPAADTTLGEQVAQMAEIIAQQAEELRAIKEAQAAREASTEAAKVAATHRKSSLTPEEALRQARAKGRAVLSSEGWVCPPAPTPTPANLAAARG